MGAPVLSDWQVVEAVSLRKRGWTFPRLAALYGTSRETVEKAVRREERSHRAAGRMEEVLA